MQFYAIITAAGKGTRMESNLQKVLHEIDKKPMVYYVVEMIKKAGIKKPVVVVGYQGNLVRQTLKKFNCVFVVQKKRLGTGHAVKQAEKILRNKTGYTVIVYGDCPFFSVRTLRKMITVVERDKPAICLTSMMLNDDTKGIVLRNKNKQIVGIIEGRNANAQQLKIKEKNAGLYLIDNQWLWSNIDKIQKNPLKGEYYLTDLIQIAAQNGDKIEGILLDDHREAMGVDTQELLCQAEKIKVKNILKK